jgi:O-antigen ligase
MYLRAAIALVLCVVYLDIPNYLFKLNPNIYPKYFYYLLFVIIAPILVLKFKEFLRYMSSPFCLWMFAEIIINSLYLLNANEALINQIKELDQYLILSSLLGFSASVTRTESYEGLFPILLAICAICCIIDFINPGFFYPINTEGAVPGRAAAMFINPNSAGEVILITTLLAIPVIYFKYRMNLLLLAGIGIFVTFSRASIMLWILLWITLLITRKLPKYSFVFSIIIVAILPLSLNSFRSYLEGSQEHSSGLNNVLARMDFFQTRSIEDDSSLERMQVLQEGLRIFSENPIFGAGSGVTTFWSYRSGTHNQIVMAAAEHGTLGIAMWMWLILILWRGKYFQDNRFQMAAAIGTFFMSFFTHNMTTDLYWLITFALISGRRNI